MASPMGKGLLMNEQLFPIYLIEGDDIMIFSSIRDVQMQLEPVFISGEEPVYDAKGRLIKIETDGRHINLLPIEKEPLHAAELEASLRKYLIAMREPMAKEAVCDLQCLVQLSLKYTCKITLKEYIASLWNRLLWKK